MVGASWNEAESFGVVGQKEQHIGVVAEDKGENSITEDTWEDESKEEAALVLDRFRVLLGFRSFHKLKPANGGSLPYWPTSPLSSPSPTTAASSTATVRPIHGQSHNRPPHLSKSHPAYKFHKHDKGRNRRKRILVATLVILGSTLVICGIVLMCASRKYYKHRTKWRTSRYENANGGRSREHSKNVSSESLASKVRHDPDFDLFYVETLATVLEPRACVKENSNTLIASSIHNSSTCTLLDIEDLEHELQKAEPREDSLSSAEQIISFNEDTVLIKYESEGHISSSGEKVIMSESQLSDDDESFYSLCCSESSNVRLSNAPSDSLSDKANRSPPKVASTPYGPPSSTQVLLMDPTSNLELCPSDQRHKTHTIPNYSDCTKDSKLMTPSPPPPPPPPPSYTTQNLTKTEFPTLLKVPSPGNLDSSQSNQASECCLPKPPKIHEPLSAPPPYPPTPCPQPVIEQKSKYLRGSPPPPPKLPQFTPLCKHGSPLPKLKPLHWDKVRAASDRSTVWDKLRCNSFELDEEMIESLFGYNLKTALETDEGKSKTPFPCKYVLEPKRLQNITILLKALNVTAEQVCNALIQGDGLSLQQLEALTKMAPTKEEEDKLSNYKGDANELGSAEKFIRAVLCIPYAFQRIEAMLFKASFDDEVVHLRSSLSMLEEACKELRSSRLFLKLLEAVLKTGNRMNVGTIRGEARAFKLDALLKLADVKGTDGKTTLLHFVVQEIARSEGIRMSGSIIGKINLSKRSGTAEEKEGDYRRMGLELVSGLSSELCNVKKTASIDLDVLASSFTNLSDGLPKLQQLTHKNLFNDATARSFVRVMNTFMNHMEKKLKELQHHEDAVLQSVREITEYFHGNVGKDEVNPLRIFVIVRDFLGMLDKVCRELKSSKTPQSPNPLAPFR
ncbi:hypothetical protein Dimus_012176 [Dionaea muscipula]